MVVTTPSNTTLHRKHHQPQHSWHHPPSSPLLLLRSFPSSSPLLPLPLLFFLLLLFPLDLFTEPKQPPPNITVSIVVGQNLVGTLAVAGVPELLPIFSSSSSSFRCYAPLPLISLVPLKQQVAGAIRWRRATVTVVDPLSPSPLPSSFPFTSSLLFFAWTRQPTVKVHCCDDLRLWSATTT